MEIVKDEQAQQQPSYDPSKKYTWAQDDLIVISGGEFGVLLNALRAIISTPEAQKILLADRANEIVEQAFARAVENGVIKEAVEEDKSSL